MLSQIVVGRHVRVGKRKTLCMVREWKGDDRIRHYSVLEYCPIVWLKPLDPQINFRFTDNQTQGLFTEFVLLGTNTNTLSTIFFGLLTAVRDN